MSCAIALGNWDYLLFMPQLPAAVDVHIYHKKSS
jgi:hypothetical protein